MQSSAKMTLLDFGSEGAPTLPTEVYAAQVESLFSNPWPLAVSMATTALGVLIAASRTGSPFLTAISLVHIVIVAYRVDVIRRYRAARPRLDAERETHARWERRFALGAYASGSALGAAGLAIFALSADDPVCQILVDALVIGYTAGGIGRNFARPLMARGPIAAALGPTAAGIAYHGGFVYETLALFMALYWLAVTEIINNLARGGQRLLMLALDNSRLAASLCGQNRRLDAALTHMPQGLCMVDAEMRLVLANRGVAGLFAIPEGALSAGASLVDLLSASSSALSASPETLAKLTSRLGAGALPSDAGELTLEDGRVVAWTRNATDDGGAVVMFEDVTEREQARARADHLSGHDDLTGLANRARFVTRLRAAVENGRRAGRPFALLFLDLDRLKFVNDTLGHRAGDALLKQMSVRLRENVGADDVVARIGGDEFVVILAHVDAPAEAERIAERLRRALAAPYTIDGHECMVSGSLGLAWYPDDATDPEGLLKCADAAMYSVKQEGKNAVRRFEPAMNLPSIKRLELESALRHAIERGEFELYYQPKLRLADGAIAGVEALLRWRRADGTLIAPDNFIDVAEDTGLIMPIGRWVITTACQQNEFWRVLGLPELRVAVNLSPRQFADPELTSIVRSALISSRIRPGLFELEITESMAMRDFERSKAIIGQIRDLGARISIDDFGAGHSSMARLKHLSIDALKVDRAFVSGLAHDGRDRAIVEAIVALGKALRLDVVGEGVEEPEQLELLREFGCDEIQGFLFAQPMPAREIPGFVRSHTLARLQQVAQREAPELAGAA